jgi:hypothetical protein
LARLWHTVDLDTVHRDLLGVTETAFQPAHFSMWLAPAPAGEQRPREAGARLHTRAASAIEGHSRPGAVIGVELLWHNHC